MGINVSRRSLLRAIPVASAAAVLPTMAVLALNDPLFDTIKEYKKQKAAFAAIPDDELTKQNEQEYVAATYEASMERLLHDTPETTSLDGVREAIRLAFEEDAFCCRISENALRSALAYLEAA